MTTFILLGLGKYKIMLYPKFFPKINSKFLIILLSLSLTPLSVGAYLDPGTGSFLIQIAVGMIASGAYLARVFWSRIISFFSRKKSNEITNNDPR